MQKRTPGFLSTIGTENLNNINHIPGFNLNRKFGGDMINSLWIRFKTWFNYNRNYIFLAIVLVAFILALAFISSCTGIPQAQKRSAGDMSGYCFWKDAPSWMAEDFLDSKMGLIDGVIVHNGSKPNCYLIKVDNAKDGDLNGDCDVVAFVCEAGVTIKRPSGRVGPGVVVLGALPCEKYDQAKREILEKSSL